MLATATAKVYLTLGVSFYHCGYLALIVLVETYAIDMK